MTTIAVLGLGEAGTLFAADLVAAGVDVRAFDPVAPAPTGVVTCAGEAETVAGADIVLSINTTGVALEVARAAAPACRPGTIYADLNSASPDRKREIAELLPVGVDFVDGVLMSTVPGKGLYVPIAVSGPGAALFADLMSQLGAKVEVVGDEPGEAATRKLVRSVFFKGLAAAVTESVAAARAAGIEDAIRGDIGAELAEADAGLVDVLLNGSRTHAARRALEMESAIALLDELGVPSRVSTASRDWLRDLEQARDE
ncbi:DUF1932 domain-containing protein [Nocardioides nematodiphilus]|uniref:DUF1932 domain-containing protein n=1 Tax=Nocardioides nematodiphilus TaxID=2849669 RepID=UPI001CD99FBF|nr:NAD(P)-dependent oxidoreductase [Nocardioides nematodiphilus]MCA1983402.1 DUF1932 domain-containing protein [Nocardioides nematodiphilus]